MVTKKRRVAKKFELRFELPPSLGTREAKQRAAGFTRHLSKQLGAKVTIHVARSYGALRDGLMAGTADAVWAPPFICAGLETNGQPVAVRGVRDGMSAYRAALVGRASERLQLEDLEGKRAAWVDPDSVGGYLLAQQAIRDGGFEPSRLLREQKFLGTYLDALRAVERGVADVASIFAAPTGDEATGLWDVLPERADSFSVIAFSDESPNDGVVWSPKLDPALCADLSAALLKMHLAAPGRELLAEMFRVERFEVAPPNSYRSLYALAGSKR